MRRASEEIRSSWTSGIFGATAALWVFSLGSFGVNAWLRPEIAECKGNAWRIDLRVQPATARCTHSSHLAADPRDGAAGLLFGRPVNLNFASQDDLESLPGLGPVRARALLAARDAHVLTSAEDLLRIRGIGPKTIQGLDGWVQGRSFAIDSEGTLSPLEAH